MCVPFVNNTIDTGTYTLNTNGVTQTNPGFIGALITIQTTSASGDMYVTLQFSPDGGTTWINYDTSAVHVNYVGSFTFIVYPGISGTYVTEAVPYPLPQTWRMVYNVTGGSSFTLSTLVNYLS
jgi:hypothetical protein